MKIRRINLFVGIFTGFAAMFELVTINYLPFVFFSIVSTINLTIAFESE